MCLNKLKGYWDFRLEAFNKILMDSSFISRLKSINGCELVNYFDICFPGKCVVDQCQYSNGPCNQTDHSCEILSELLSDEEAISFAISYPGDEHLEMIFDIERETGDFVDLKMLAFAHNAGNSVILTCDLNLMRLCEDISIVHYCLKAALVRLSQFDRDIFSSALYDTSSMVANQERTDPFYHYGNNRHCISCDPKGKCEYQNPPISS